MHPPFSSTQFDHHLFALSTFDSNVPVQLRLCSEFQRRIHNLRYCNENCKRKRKIYQSIIDQHFNKFSLSLSLEKFKLLTLIDVGMAAATGLIVLLKYQHLFSGLGENGSGG